MNPETPPTFLVGPARSGTTMVYKLLCLHPRAAFLSNYVRRAPGLPELAVLNRLTRVATHRRQDAWFGHDGNAYVYGAKRRFAQWAFPAPVEAEPVFRHDGFIEYRDQRPLPAAERNDRIRRSFERARRADGGQVLINKRIANNRRIPELLDAFPDARFLCLVRDGRAVAQSLSKVDWWEDGKVWFTDATPREWAAQGKDPWELCAKHWVEELLAMEEGLRQVPAEQVLRISYEDFLARSGTLLPKMADFAGLGPSALWDRARKGVTLPKAKESWRTAFSPETLGMIEDIQGEQLQRLGYPLVTPGTAVPA